MVGVNANDVKARVEERIVYLKRLIDHETRKLGDDTTNQLNKRSLIVAKKNKGYQYYIEENGKEGKTRSYVGKERMESARTLAQNSYDHKLLTIAREELRTLESFLRTYDAKSDRLEDCYRKLSDARKMLVLPTVPPSELYAAQWQEADYKRKEFKEGQQFYMTARGEKVRSKSEVLIADEMDRSNMFYRYECQLILPNGKIYYPDYTILNEKTRGLFYWEHLGKLGDPDYVNDNLVKLNDYAKAGIIPGKNLILTFESDKVPLNTETVKEVIRTFF